MSFVARTEPCRLAADTTCEYVVDAISIQKRTKSQSALSGTRGFLGMFPPFVLSNESKDFRKRTVGVRCQFSELLKIIARIRIAVRHRYLEPFFVCAFHLPVSWLNSNMNSARAEDLHRYDVIDAECDDMVMNAQMPEPFAWVPVRTTGIDRGLYRGGSVHERRLRMGSDFSTTIFRRRQPVATIRSNQHVISNFSTQHRNRCGRRTQKLHDRTKAPSGPLALPKEPLGEVRTARHPSGQLDQGMKQRVGTSTPYDPQFFFN